MFSRDVDEINENPSLVIWSGFLFLCFSLIAFFWQNYSLELVLSGNANRVCWPFFENCSELTMPPFLYRGLLVILFSGGLIGAWFAWFERKFLFTFFCFLLFLKAGLFFLDYRMMGNYHYMHFILAGSFLFLPRKRYFLPFLIILFYVSAGKLKVNPEWLTGVTLYKKPKLNEYVWLFSLYSVVILELFAIWGLLSRSKFVRYFTFCWVVAFHFISFYWVGYFYPILMLLLISIFPIQWLINYKDFNWKSLSPINYFVATVFLSFQFFPDFVSDKSGVTGEARFWSLNMYDDNVNCETSFQLKSNKSTFEYSFDRDRWALRTGCDPLVIYQKAKHICKSIDRSTMELDVFMVSKGAFEPRFLQRLGVKNFCRESVTYSMFKNDWIRK